MDSNRIWAAIADAASTWWWSQSYAARVVMLVLTFAAVIAAIPFLGWYLDV